MWIRVQVLPSSACLESNRTYNFSQGHTQSGASPVVRSNSTQSTGFDITVLASRGRICFINLIGIASRYASAIPSCVHVQTYPLLAPDWIYSKKVRVA